MIFSNLSAQNESIQEVKDTVIEGAFKLYPNPVINTLHIETNIEIKRIEIHSIVGNKVKEIRLNFTSIDLSDLSRGIYMVKIYTNGGTTVRKMIKK